MKTRIISFTNNKGGVGKTTSTINIGCGLARKGKRVLLIDLDGQASLCISLGINPNEHLENSIVQVLLKQKDIKECILKLKENVYIIPSNDLLYEAVKVINGKPYKESILKKAIEPIKEVFDYILIDCPPSLDVLTENALGSSTEAILPIQAEYLALQGTSQIVNKINEMKEGNEDLELTGVFATLYDARTNLSKEVNEVLQNTFKDKAFKTIISKNVSLAEAPSHQEDIFSYEPNSTGAKDYEALVEEIIKQEERGVNEAEEL